MFLSTENDNSNHFYKVNEMAFYDVEKLDAFNYKDGNIACIFLVE